MEILPLTSFTLGGVTYEFLSPERIGPHSDIHSWEYGHYPKVHARIPLRDGGTVAVYAHATHWNKTQISAQWYDDDKNSLTAWIPRENVRPVTNSEWDIDQYNRCPEWLRVVRWGKRLPGMLPE